MLVALWYDIKISIIDRTSSCALTYLLQCSSNVVLAHRHRIYFGVLEMVLHHRQREWVVNRLELEHECAFLLERRKAEWQQCAFYQPVMKSLMWPDSVLHLYFAHLVETKDMVGDIASIEAGNASAEADMVDIGGGNSVVYSFGRHNEEAHMTLHYAAGWD